VPPSAFFIFGSQSLADERRGCKRITESRSNRRSPKPGGFFCAIRFDPFTVFTSQEPSR
jgi:hypothetical protein